MAVEKTVLDSKLVVVTDDGTTKNGKAVTTDHSFGNLKVAATDEQALACGSAIAGLMADDLDSVKRVDTATLSYSE